jgi:hypothetical protein
MKNITRFIRAFRFLLLVEGHWTKEMVAAAWLAAEDKQDKEHS